MRVRSLALLLMPYVTNNITTPPTMFWASAMAHTQLHSTTHNHLGPMTPSPTLVLYREVDPLDSQGALTPEPRTQR